MNNSAISRSNSFKVNKKLSQQENQKNVQTINSIQSFQQYLASKQQKSKYEQGILTPLKKQLNKKEEYSNKNVKIGHKNNKQIQSPHNKPLFSGFRNEEKPYSYNIGYQDQKSNKQNNQEKVSNDLIKTKHTLKQSLDNSLNQSINRSEIQQNIKQQIQLNNYQKQNLFFRNKVKEDDLIFGQGLQQIGTSNQNSNSQVYGRISRQNFHSAKKIQSSSLIQTKEKYKKQKMSSYRPMGDVDFKSTGRSFFKRPISFSNSQQYFKPYIKDYSRGQNRQAIFNRKSIVNSSKEKKNRQSIFQKTQPIDRDRNESYILYNNRNIPKIGDFQRVNNFKKQRNYLSFSNNINKLVFKYNGGHATTLYNYKLKIKNESQTTLGIKIQCTSPRHYQVRPFNNTILQPQQILSLTIQMKLYPHDLDPISMKHDLSRYKNDKFRILYWTNDSLNDFDFYQEQRILPVIVQQTQQLKLRSDGLEKNLIDQKTKQASKENEIQMYKKSIEKNTQKMNQIDIKINKIESLKYKDGYFNLPLFVLIVILGFFIGFWFG